MSWCICCHTLIILHDMSWCIRCQPVILSSCSAGLVYCALSCLTNTYRDLSVVSFICDGKTKVDFFKKNISVQSRIENVVKRANSIFHCAIHWAVHSVLIGRRHCAIKSTIHTIGRSTIEFIYISPLQGRTQKFRAPLQVDTTAPLHQFFKECMGYLVFFCYFF